MGSLLKQFMAGVGGGRSWSSYWTTLKAAMTNQPSQAYSMAANTFVTSLVDGGVWAKLDRLFVFQAETNAAGEALLDWIHPTGTAAVLANGVGGSVPTFTANQGFNFTAANKSYVNTQYNPTLHATNFSQNSASIGFCFRKLNLANGQMQMGTNAADGQTKLACAPRYNSASLHEGGTYYGIVNGGGWSSSAAYQYYAGIYSVVRYSATNLYRYRLSVAEDVAINSAAIADGIIDVGRCTNAYYTDGQISMAYIGGLLLQADINILVDAYETFREAIDCIISMLGDSTIGLYSGTDYEVSRYMDNDNYSVMDFAHTGNNIAQQKARFLAAGDPYLSHIKCVFVAVGINDLAMTTANLIAAYQDLIDTIRAKIGANHKIVGCTMTPGIQGADQQWSDLNDAIMGVFTTNITGLDSTIDVANSVLNDGSDGLAALYNSGDNKHENAAGRQIIADLLDAKLTELGL